MSTVTWNQFYVTHLHSKKMLKDYTGNKRNPSPPKPSKRKKPTVYAPSSPEHCLWPLHFEKKRKHNKWPELHCIAHDSKLSYYRQTNEYEFCWVYTTTKRQSVDDRVCETQADDDTSPIHSQLSLSIPESELLSLGILLPSVAAKSVKATSVKSLDFVIIWTIWFPEGTS